MPVTLSPLAGAGQQFFDNNGNPLTGGKLYTYSAGTTTPLAAYTTNSGAIAHTNPIILDSAGRVPSGGEIWLTLGVGYKFVLATSTDVVIATYDNIPSSAQPPAANDADSIQYEQGYTVTAGGFTIGQTYRILTIGNTDFTLIGAASNTVGVHFVATGVGTGTGTAELSQTIEARLRKFLLVTDFGAKADGVTNDSAAFAAARAAAAALGLKVRVPSGHYKLNTALTASTDLILEGDGPGTILDFTGTVTGGSYALEAIGTATQIQDLGATATVGTYTVTFASAASLAVGDVFVIFNPTTSSWSGFRSNYYAGEWCEVESVSGTTVTLRNQLYDTYDSADVDVYKITGPKVVLRNFAIRGTTVTGLINTSLCIAPLIENVTCDHANNSAISFSRCFKPTVINPDVRNVGDGGNDYGIVVGNSQHARIMGGYVYSRRHAITHGGGAEICSVPVRDSRIIGSVLKNDTDSGTFTADFHGNTEDSSYIDCTIYGGATWQGKDVEYVNCTITSDGGGRVMYSAEIKGGRFGLTDCKLITHVDPQPSTRGVVDIGGNNSPVTADTVLNATFSVNNCKFYGRNLTNLTSFMIFTNRGSSVKTNLVVDGVEADVNLIGQVLLTNNVSGSPAADFIIVDRISGFLSGTLLHNPVGNHYRDFAHRCQKQTGKVDLTATSGTSSTIAAPITFNYQYPRPPVGHATSGGLTAQLIIGNRAALSTIRQMTVSQITPAIISPDATNWAATATVTVNWTAHIDDV